jgi:mono/diheme cytochrome c family protein
MRTSTRRALAAGMAAVAQAATLSPVAAQDDPRFALGRTVFLERAEPGCPICHTLAEAGTSGAVGPNLDTLKPDYGRVRMAVENGVGPMVPQEALSAEEVDALAYYVAAATGGATE